MRESAKYIVFASVSVIEVLHNIPSSNMQKRLMMLVRGKKRLFRKKPGLYLFTFVYISGQRKTLQSHMFVLDN